jgi:hypothetical protein
MHDCEALVLSIVTLCLSHFIWGVFNHVVYSPFSTCLAVDPSTSLAFIFLQKASAYPKSFTRDSSYLSKQKLLDSHESFVTIKKMRRYPTA